MPRRYFTTEIDGHTAWLRGAEARHLAVVLRAAPGTAVLLCNGQGSDYDAEVETAAPDAVRLRIIATRPSVAEPALWAEVFMGVAKGERMDWAVQKSVELGASAIRPFYSANCVVKPARDAEKTARWARVAAEAAKQSGRGLLPVVHPPLPFAGALRQAAALGGALFFYEGGGISVASALHSLPGAQSLALICGPEGGFTPAEAAEAGVAGCQTVGLGPRILRCETAPIAALAAVMTLKGDL